MLLLKHQDFNCVQCDFSFGSKSELKQHIVNCHNSPKRCTFCGAEFLLHCELEGHISEKHSNIQKHECDQCELSFYSQWRLNKHIQWHKIGQKRRCHFFNNGKTCPFFEKGCKFLHELAEECFFGNTCKLDKCQFRHSSRNGQTVTSLDGSMELRRAFVPQWRIRKKRKKEIWNKRRLPCGTWGPGRWYYSYVLL